jgi:hypothetical protein
MKMTMALYEQGVGILKIERQFAIGGGGKLQA